MGDLHTDDFEKPHFLSVNAELIKTFYRQGNTALIGVLATATGISIGFYNEIPTTVIVIWLVFIYVLSFVRFLSIRRFFSLRINDVDIVYWGRLFSFFAFLSGLSWAAASMFFYSG